MLYSRITQSVPEVSLFSFWQSTSWKDILQTSGQVQDVFYFGSCDGSLVLVEIRQIGLSQSGAFILGVNTDQVGEDFLDCINALQLYLRDMGILFLQIEPLDVELPMVSARSVYKAFLTQHTQHILLSEENEKILSGMHEKGRYNIRLAEKRGIRVLRVDPSEEHIDTWMNLLSDTTSRDGFVSNSRTYYKTFLDQISAAHGGLYFAYYDTQVIAAGIFVFYHDRGIYYYGASVSDREMRKHMAPYLLQWQAIQDARRYECDLYDFLGIADPLDPLDPLRGVTDFKSKFGGISVILPKKVLLPLSWKYGLFILLRKIFRR